MHLQKEKIIIVITVLIDVLGLGVISPVLPFYVESFGAPPITLMLLLSVFSFFSFVSGSFLGSLSDKIGRRPVLIISLFSTAIGWFVFASAHAIWVLFLGRIIDGIAAGNLPIAQSYLVDIARDEKERTTNLGLIGSVFGVGFIVGPAIGAAFSSISHTLPFYFVAGLAALNTVCAIFFLPESHKHMDYRKQVKLNPFQLLFTAAKDNRLRARYAAWFLFGTSLSAMQSVFAVYMNKVHGFNSVMVGIIYTSMGVIVFLNQTILLRKFWLKHFKETALEVWPLLFSAIGLISLVAPHVHFFILGIVIYVLSQSLSRVAITSGAAAIAGPLRRGEVLGAMSSVLSVAMIGGPLLAGSLFQINPFLPFAACSLSIGCGFIIMKSYESSNWIQRKLPHIKKS